MTCGDCQQLTHPALQLLLNGLQMLSLIHIYEYRITLKGTLSHTVTLGADVFGNITRLDNALENLSLIHI